MILPVTVAISTPSAMAHQPRSVAAYQEIGLEDEVPTVEAPTDEGAPSEAVPDLLPEDAVLDVPTAPETSPAIPSPAPTPTVIATSTPTPPATRADIASQPDPTVQRHPSATEIATTLRAEVDALFAAFHTCSGEDVVQLARRVIPTPYEEYVLHEFDWAVVRMGLAYAQRPTPGHLLS
jgi:hypothetical protein